jgi:hypothetical protein
LSVGNHPPFVVRDDRPYIDAFNATLKQSDPGRICLDLPPCPFHGHHDSPLVVLLGNPLWKSGTLSAYEDHAWTQAALDELHSERGARFYALDEEWAKELGGIWWRQCLAGLHKAGLSYELLAEKVMSVDFHGYYSERRGYLPVTLPSQHFGFHLVRAAIDRRAIIVLIRAKREWSVAVPGLASYRGLVRASNPQISNISPGNLGPENFERVLDALRR